MKKWIVGLLALLIHGGTAHAQWSWNAVAGVGLSTMNDFKTKYDLKSGVSYHIGAGAEYALGSGFSAGATLQFVTRSFETEGYGGEDAYHTEYDATGLELPITVIYRFSLPQAVRLGVFTGPAFGYGLGGSFKTTVSGAGGVKTKKGDFYGDDGHAVTDSRFDVGWNLGVSAEIHRFLLKVDGTWGLTGHEIFGNSNNKPKQVRYGLSVGYRF